MLSVQLSTFLLLSGEVFTSENIRELNCHHPFSCEWYQELLTFLFIVSLTHIFSVVVVWSFPLPTRSIHHFSCNKNRLESKGRFSQGPWTHSGQRVLHSRRRWTTCKTYQSRCICGDFQLDRTRNQRIIEGNSHCRYGSRTETSAKKWVEEAQEKAPKNGLKMFCTIMQMMNHLLGVKRDLPSECNTSWMSQWCVIMNLYVSSCTSCCIDAPTGRCM